jgi:hypothetical protein
VEGDLATIPDEVKAAFGECLPFLLLGHDQGSDLYAAIAAGVDALKADSLSWARLNQLMHRCSEAGMSEGCFRYYFLEVPLSHPYPVERVSSPSGYRPPKGVVEITSIDQAHWGLRRFIYDAMLYWGNFRQAFRDLRLRSFEEIVALFSEKRINEQRMATRGKVIGPTPIPRDHRYLISEMACKTYEAKGALKDTDHVKLALEAGIITGLDYVTKTMAQPAKVGETVIAWATGLGPIAGNDAVVAPSPLFTNVEVLVGNQPATVVAAGRSGCCAGLDQIAFTVPSAPLGCYVPVSIRVAGGPVNAGGSVSNFVTLPLS